jgi:hypothetical protein
VAVEIPLWLAHRQQQQQQQAAPSGNQEEEGAVKESWGLLGNTGSDRRLSIYSIDAHGNRVATAG